MFRFISIVVMSTIALTPLVAAKECPLWSSVVLDREQNVVRYYGIPIDLTIKKLSRLGYRFKLGHEKIEDTVYSTADIVAKGGIRLKVSFDSAGKLDSVETFSRDATSPKNIRVGSTLAEVRTAWPSGKFIYSCEDGFHVVYITGTNVLYDFNPKDMPPQAFRCAELKDAEIPNLRVRNIRISSIPVSVP